MDTREEEFLKRLQAMFQVEAEEHVKLLSDGLLELEKKPDKARYVVLVENVFRETHSLKGASRSVERTDIESICQILEGIFSRVKSNLLVLTSTQFDLIHQTVDGISKLVVSPDALTPANVRALIRQLKTIGQLDTDVKSEAKPIETGAKGIDLPADIPPPQVIEKKSTEEPTSATETLRIPTSKLNPIFLQAEQLIQSKIVAAQHVDDLRHVLASIREWKSALIKRSSTKIVGFDDAALEIVNCNKNRLLLMEESLNSMYRQMEGNQRLLGRLIDEHLESIKNVLTFPMTSMLEGFPKMVRDLSRSLGKEVELVMTGMDLEVDNRILKELKDPLIHLVRNSIDHGIAPAKDRVAANKPPVGTINLKVSATEGRMLEMVISDDGSGVDLKKVAGAALKRGLVAADQMKQLSDPQVLELIFQSGISSSPLITDLSGRGLGLAIVKEKVEKLGGSVSVESVPQMGTTFRIVLPLTIATLRGVLVRAEQQSFLIPTQYVQQVSRITPGMVRKVENADTCYIDDETIPLVKLAQVLQLKEVGQVSIINGNQKGVGADYHQILVLQNGAARLGVVVDQILDEHQMLVKSMGKQLIRVQHMGGAAILGSGKVVPVIHIPDLFRTVKKNGALGNGLQKPNIQEKVHKILVTEDSITSRTLIKEILESAGYLVETAVDGLDGYNKAQTEVFDLVVSDVDMPKMNGFELTTKIRAHDKINALPVVLVTALGSREDQERGIDVGASAYIVKSNFEQSNLLEVVKKLL